MDIDDFLNNPGTVAADMVSSRSMTCDRHGPWTESTVRYKTGAGRFMLLPSRCPGCSAQERQDAEQAEKQIAMWIAGTPEWTAERR